MPLILLATSGLFCWLAIDAWRFRAGADLPAEKLAELRGNQTGTISTARRQSLKLLERRVGLGRTNYIPALFAAISVASLFGSILSAIY
jgi:hypothetical protein